TCSGQDELGRNGFDVDGGEIREYDTCLRAVPTPPGLIEARAIGQHARSPEGVTGQILRHRFPGGARLEIPEIEQLRARLVQMDAEDRAGYVLADRGVLPVGGDDGVKL